MNNKKPLHGTQFSEHLNLTIIRPPSPSMCFPSPKKKSNGKQRNQSGLCGCQRAPKSHCISAIGVLILVALYTAMGSIIFVTLEGDADDSSGLETSVAESKHYPRTDLENAQQIRSRTVDRLWSITEDLNILYKDNWTRLAAQEVQIFQDSLLRAVKASKMQQPGVQSNNPSHKWSYSSAFLYSLTLITTIGYGGVSPRTQWGRIAAVIYALFGIPIVLLYLSAMGEGLSSIIRCLLRIRGRKLNSSNLGSINNSRSSTSSNNLYNQNSSSKMHNTNAPYQISNSSNNGLISIHSSYLNPSVPISVCILILICYVSVGAILFHKLQNWGVVEALYFCFTSLGTIGFGDLLPTGQLSQYLASGYILFGMAVVAMCFSLIQTELILWLRKFSIQDQVILANTSSTPHHNDDVSLVSLGVQSKS